ncbi:MAG: M48 family metallopeptidase [Verrucomicrobia bacterium]|nr:M48 family metallopeptidase [Verrucomicrobiota bacterium]
MTRNNLTFVALLAAVVLTGCSTVPITGRSQLLLISSQQEVALGMTEFEKIKKQSRISHDPTWAPMLQRIGSRISAIAPLPNAQWEFVLLDDPKTVNAFCLPGGKVSVYTGILGIAKDEGGLATIVGHEIAHAVARHGSERMSHGILVQAGGVVLDTAMQSRTEANRQAFMTAYGLASQVGFLLPYSRKQEYEADHLGVIYMARAGYDPRAAVELWQRFAAYSKQHPNNTPSFLRTHPVDEARIAQIQKLMPAALKEYNNPPGATAPASAPARR